MSRKPHTRNALLAALVLAVVPFLVPGAGQAAAPAATPVASSTCGPVQYEGAGAAESLIVSDLPLRGASSQRSTQMNDAIRLALRAAGWKAGKVHIGSQACDASDAATGLWSKPICQANANAYAADASVL